MRLRTSGRSFSILCCLGLSASPMAAEVRTDGLLGDARTLSGSDIEVPQDLGQRRGTNLFHSLSSLAIGEGDAVRFTGDGNLEHVITRVTGGSISRIDGLLSSEIGSSGFWLINPAGLVFGENAQIDVPSGFHVSTGSEVRFADGTLFAADKPNASSLSVAAPDDFGFLGAGGDLTFSGAQLAGGGSFQAASGGNLIANEDTSIVMNNDSNLRLSAQNLLSISDNASVRLTNSSSSDATSGIRVSADMIELSGLAEVITETAADGNAGFIDLQAQDIRLSERAVVSSVTRGGGMAGRVSIEGGNLAMTGTGTPSQSAIISSSSQSGGDAGGVSIELGGSLDLSDGARITSNAISTGDGGRIGIEAETISLQSNARISSSGNSLDGETGGAGGVIEIETGKLEIRDARIRTQSEKRSGDITLTLRNGMGSIEISGSGSQVSSETFPSGGAAGHVRINGGSGSLRLMDRGTVSVIARGPASGGNIEIDAGQMEMTGRSVVTATTTGSGQGGQVRLNIASLDMQGSGNPQQSAIVSSSSLGQGNAGGVFIAAEQGVSLRNGARITSNATDRGDGGQVSITAPQIQLLANARISSSGNEIKNATGGAGGRIDLRADEFLIDNSRIRTESEKLSGDISLSPLDGAASIGVLGNSAQISSATFQSGGQAGTVRLDAGSGAITLADNASVNAVNRGSGKGGTVEVLGDTLSLSGMSRITTTTEGSEDAGQVSVTVGDLVIQGNDGDRQASPIISSSSLNSGNAGLVSVFAARGLTLKDGGRITSNSTSSGRSGNVEIRTSSLFITGNSAVSSSGNPSELGGSGDAGGISIDAENITIEGSAVRTEASNAIGGQLSIRAADTLLLNRSLVVTDGLRAADGSSLITLNAGGFLIVNKSLVFSRVTDTAPEIGAETINTTGIANLIGGQITISSDSDLQATFALNVIGQENDVGSGLALPETLFASHKNRLEGACAVNGTGDRSSFSSIRLLTASPLDPLAAAAVMASAEDC